MKRKRGGQPGNNNARKHGLYCGSMTPDEMCRFWDTLNAGVLEPEIAVLRVKLFSAINRNPGNRRVIRDAARLMARWYSVKLRLNKVYSNRIRKCITAILEAQCSGKSASFLEEELKYLLDE